MPASSTGRVFIIVRAPNGDVREVPIGATAIVIGRDESADIRVEDKKVSRRHAAFKLVDGEPWVEDLGSANGVKLNGKRIDKRAKMNASDTVKVGGYKITLKDLAEDTGSSVLDDDRKLEKERGPSSAVKSPPNRDSTPPRPPPEGAKGRQKKVVTPPDDGRSPVLIAIDDPVKGQRFVMRLGENIIGRLEECDVPVLDGSVSRQHARVVFSRERISVTDLGASNGTFVNDTRVEMAELAHGDVLRVGNVRFRLELPPELSKQLSTPKARARPTKSSASRMLAKAGIAVLLLAIAVLSATIYWKWRGRHELGTKLGGADAGEVIREVTLTPDASEIAVKSMPDAGGESKTPQPDAGEKVAVKTVQPDAGGDKIEPVKAHPATLDAGTKVEVVEHPDGFGSPSARDGRALPDQGPVRPVTPADAGGGAIAALLPDAGAPPEVAMVIRPVATGTSPYTKRGDDGLPIDLPIVDTRFDFDAFVDEKVTLAEQLEKDGDFRRVRTVVVDLLEHDPINQKGKEIRQRLELHEMAEQAFSQAEKLEAKGNLSKALKLYMAVPENAPEIAKAKAKVEALRPQVIELELQRADKDLKTKQTWPKAQKRFKDVLDFDPENATALKGIRTVERKMRMKNMKYSAYIPPNAKESLVKESPQDIDEAISKRYTGEDELRNIAKAYAQGHLPLAIKKAEAYEKRAEGSKKEDAKKVRAALKTIQSAHERIRNEISNNPNEAWAKLRDLENAEGNVLPPDVKSIGRKEIEESIAEAFARQGSSFFERNNFEGAFTSWNSGWKLDPGNPTVLAGLKKLEERAKVAADEAELAGQRGEKDVCSKWKSITRFTRADSEIYKRANERAKQICRT